MDNPSYIALIDAHAESNSGTDDTDTVIDKSLLYLLPFVRQHPCMIGSSRMPHEAEHSSHLISCITTQTVDNAALVRMECKKGVYHLVFLPLFQSFHYGQVQIGAMERSNKDRGISHLQLTDNVFARHLVGCSSES